MKRSTELISLLLLGMLATPWASAAKDDLPQGKPFQQLDAAIQAAEAAAQDALDAERLAREAADAAIEAALAAEEEARIAADNAEATAREAGDRAEATARAAADKAERAARTAADQAQAAALATERLERIGGDELLQAQIDELAEDAETLELRLRKLQGSISVLRRKDAELQAQIDQLQLELDNLEASVPTTRDLLALQKQIAITRKKLDGTLRLAQKNNQLITNINTVTIPSLQALIDEKQDILEGRCGPGLVLDGFTAEGGMICSSVSQEANITRFTVSRAFSTPWRTCLRWVRLSDGSLRCLGGYNTPRITASVNCPTNSVIMGGSFEREAAFLITEAPRISGSAEQPGQSYQVVGYDRRGNPFGSAPRRGTLIVRANCVRFNINP